MLACLGARGTIGPMRKITTHCCSGWPSECCAASSPGQFRMGDMGRLVFALLLMTMALVPGPTQALDLTTRHYCGANVDPSNIACNCPKVHCQCFYDSTRKVHGSTEYQTHCRGLKDIPSGIYPLSTSVILEGGITSLETLSNAAVIQLHVVSILNISHNAITELTGNSFRGALPVEHLYLSHNTISRIDPGEFKSLTVLITLDLSYNRLTSLPSGLFSNCKHLTVLNLQHNQLIAIPRFAFPARSVIQALYLTNNSISSVSQSDFGNLTNLRMLYLDSNGIHWLSADYIQNTNKQPRFPTPRLEYLSLLDNKINVIPPSFFLGLSNLLNLILSSNPLQGRISQMQLNGLTSLQHLDLSLTNITKDSLDSYALHKLTALQDLNLESTSMFTKADALMFWYPGNMINYLDLRYTNFTRLLEIGDSTTQPPTCRLETLDAIGSKIASLKWSPGFELCTLCDKLEAIDFSFSDLWEIDNLQGCTELTDLLLNHAKFTSKSIENTFFNHTSVRHIDLTNNRIDRISNKVFGYMPNLETLKLDNNAQLAFIDPDAFSGLTGLRFLSMTYTPRVTSLPLGSFNMNLRELYIQGNSGIRHFPQLTELSRLLIAKLYYPYHCCQYQAAAEKERDRKAAIAAAATTSLVSPTPVSTPYFEQPTAVNVSGFHDGRTGLVDRHNEDEERRYNETWLKGNVERIPMYSPAAAGDPKKDLLCSPEVTPFTPCRDMFAELWLRIIAWCVSLLALGGNITVIIVIIFGKHKMDNTHYLVLNLAMADLCMGVYLLILCVVDASTRGDFSATALDWMASPQAKVAGVLAVLSTEMSFYTLTLITIERYITIQLAMNKYKVTRKRLYLLVGIGWVFALTLALLPVAGISSYTNNILALPFDISTVVDKTYVAFVLIFNGLCIVLISVCYTGIYLKVRFSSVFSEKDNTIARRMALLVLVDLACWLPLAVLGLAATFTGEVLVGYEAAKIFAVFVFPLNSCANPFLYAIVTNHFQRDLIHILKTFPEKVGDLSRRRSSVVKGTPQPSDSKSLLQHIAQYVAQEARRNLNGQEGSGASYNNNNNSSTMPALTSTGGQVPNPAAAGAAAQDNRRRTVFPFDARLAAASQLDAESSSEGNSSLMSPMPGSGENCERRGTIISYQASQITDITECGVCAAPSEAGDTAHTPTSTNGSGGDLESSSSHRVLPPPAVTTGAAVLPEISEQSDRSSSSTAAAAAAITSVGSSASSGSAGPKSPPALPNPSSSPPSRIVGGLLMGALSAFTPILASHSSARAAAAAKAQEESTAEVHTATSGTGTTNLVATAAVTPETIDENSMVTEKADVEAMESEREKTSECYRAVKRSSAASSVSMFGSTSAHQPHQSSPVPTSDKEPFCGGLIETSL